MNTSDDGVEPLGEAPDVPPTGWVGDAVEPARESHVLRNAIDDIRALMDDPANLFRVPSFQVRGILDRYGL